VRYAERLEKLTGRTGKIHGAPRTPSAETPVAMRRLRTADRVTEYALHPEDSCHPSDKPFVVVAGFLASAWQWLAFESRRKAALRRYRLAKSST
jgi:hypothetical protein